MKEEITWEYLENNMKNSPIKGNWYLVKGFIILNGRQSNIARLVYFNGSSFDNCTDMVIQRFAQIVL